VAGNRDAPGAESQDGAQNRRVVEDHNPDLLLAERIVEGHTPDVNRNRDGGAGNPPVGQEGHNPDEGGGSLVAGGHYSPAELVGMGMGIVETLLEKAARNPDEAGTD